MSQQGSRQAVETQDHWLEKARHKGLDSSFHDFLSGGCRVLRA